MGLVSGPISANSLIEKLAQAKKIMNKVDSGDFEKGNIDESMITSEEGLINNPENLMMENNIIEERPSETLLTPVGGTVNPERINQSKLPEEIKRAMLEKPIPVPDISLSDTVDMNIFAGAKRLIEQENKGKTPIPRATSQKTQPSSQQFAGNNIDLIQSLTPIIENTIRKVLDEKLTQLLTVQKTQNITENLILRVGDSIFEGKITKVKKAK